MKNLANSTLCAAILAGILVGSTTTAEAGGIGGLVKSAKSLGGKASGTFKKKVNNGGRKKSPVLSPAEAFRKAHRHVKVRVDPHIRNGKSELQKKGIGKPSARKIQAERQRWKQRTLIERDNASRFFNHRVNGNNRSGGNRKSGSGRNDGDTQVGGLGASLRSHRSNRLTTQQILNKYRRPTTIRRNLTHRRIFGR